MQAFYLARQPIYDRRLELEGYELLFRAGPDDGARFGDADQATAEVIASSIVDIGLDNLVGSGTAFVNATAGVLHGALPLPELKGQIVLEVLEDVVVDEALLERLDVLRRSGYRLALDDFEYAPGCEPLLELADYVKLDVLALDRDALAEHVARLRRYDLRLIAEKVETHEDLGVCRALDFDLFQGFFFCRPELVSGRRASPNRVAVLQLVAALQDPGAGIGDLERLVSTDPALSHRLLKYINSAYCGMRTTVASIRQALVMVGTEMVRNWATVMLMSQLADDKPVELVTTALVRARMCELLGAGDPEHDPHQYFTLGLMSVLDALLDLPMADALVGLPLEEETKAALCGRTGVLGNVLGRVIDYEQAELTDDELRAGDADDYLASVAWAAEVQQALAA